MSMKWKWTIQAILIAALVMCSLAYGVVRYMADRYPERYVLDAPLPVYSDTRVPAGVLPVGTVLVLEQLMPEGGFNHYSVAVNVFGPDLPLTRATRPNLVEPLEAYVDDPAPRGEGGMALDDDALVGLLRAYRVKREDLERVAGRLE